MPPPCKNGGIAAVSGHPHRENGGNGGNGGNGHLLCENGGNGGIAAVSGHPHLENGGNGGNGGIAAVSGHTPTAKMLETVKMVEMVK